MRDFDETDLEILAILVEDARAPYSDIASRVDLSAPAVRDRIDRLREAGVIRRFTIDVDRSTLREGVPVLIELDVEPDAIAAVRDDLLEADGVEHVFTAADPRLVVQASVPDGDVRSFLADAIDTSAVSGYDVTLLTGVEWAPAVGGTTFALECAECGNTVTAEGTATRLDGSLYHFCCPSCEAQFSARYADLQSGA